MQDFVPVNKSPLGAPYTIIVNQEKRALHYNSEWTQGKLVTNLQV